jgi:hypothetical protein
LLAGVRKSGELCFHLRLLLSLLLVFLCLSFPPSQTLFPPQNVRKERETDKETERERERQREREERERERERER